MGKKHNGLLVAGVASKIGFMSSEAPALNLQEGSGPAAKAAYLDLFLRSLDAILLVDITSGKIVEANDSAAKTFRLPLDALYTKTVYDYCAPEFLAEFKKMLRIASRRYHPKILEVPLLVGAPVEPIITELAASPLKLNDQSEVLQLIFRDITDKKKHLRQIEEANKKLEELATTDGMTGLTNFRQFMKLLEAEHVRCVRYKSNYSVVFCDIDHFKKYNDNNGHPAGDALLKGFAKLVRACVRNTDVPARYGGEEFVVLCPETNIKDAWIVAERIRQSVAASKFPNGDKQPLGMLSVSIGVASFPQDGTDFKQVLKTADDMLYFCKANGRNRVTMSKGLGNNPPIPKKHD